MKALAGKKLVITGAGRGIGAALAQYAANLGAAVVVNDLDAAPANEVAERIRANNGLAVSHVADISSWKEAGELIDRCVDEFGDIDGLVNNAGLFRMGRIEEMTAEHLQAILAVNVNGTAFCAHHAAKRMMAKRKGSIVNITSGAHMGIDGMGAYGASKGAVASFTYCWAIELGPLGIRVNAISPLGETRMGQTSTDYLTSHGRPLLPQNPPPPVSNCAPICYLLSDLSAGVNGQVIRTEGRHLSLVAHPMVAAPLLEDDWTVEKVADAFDKSLSRHLFPLGIHSAEVKPVGSGSDFWKTAAKT